MDDNPYASPTAPLTDDSPDVTTAWEGDVFGVWQHKGLLVVDRFAHCFPDRCLKTNVPTNGSFRELRFARISWLGNLFVLFGLAVWLVFAFPSLAWLAVLLGVGAFVFVVISYFGHVVRVRVPLADNWESLVRLQRIAGVAMGLACLAIVVGGSVAGIIVASTTFRGAIIESAVGMTLLSLVLGLIGAAFRDRYLERVRAPLVRRCDDRVLFVANVCSEFLESLPRWPGGN